MIHHSVRPVRTDCSARPARVTCAAAPCAPRLAYPRIVARSRLRPHPPRLSRKGRQGRPTPALPSTSRRWQEGQTCATAIPHQVGCDRRRPCISSILGVFTHVANLSSVSIVSDVCFQVFHLILHMLLWLYTHVSARMFQMFFRFLL